MTTSRSLAPRHADPAPDECPRASRRLRVLLALGATLEAAAVEAARRALEDAGVAVTVARDAHAALESGLGDPPDALIVDPRLPAADVVATMRFAGYRGPVLAWIDAPGAPDVGADACVRPPLDAAALLAGPLAGVAAPGDAADGFDDLPEFSALRASFERALPATLARVVAFARAADWSGLAGELHRLKGSAGAFGRPDLTRDARRAGALLDAGRREEAARLCVAMAAPEGGA